MQIIFIEQTLKNFKPKPMTKSKLYKEIARINFNLEKEKRDLLLRYAGQKRITVTEIIQNLIDKFIIQENLK